MAKPTYLIMNIETAIISADLQPAAYVLQSEQQDYLYKGSCRNLKKRLQDHKAGRVSRTKNRRPLTLVYFEYFDSYTDARKKENYLKTGAGRDFIRNILDEIQ